MFNPEQKRKYSVGSDRFIVVDAGASYGEFFGEFVETFPEIFKNSTYWALEPSRAARKVLFDVCGEHKNVVIYSFALCGKCDDVAFTEFIGKNGRYHQWGNIYGNHKKKRRDFQEINEYSVPGITIPVLLKNIGRIDYLKMDIEGAELDTLRAMRKGDFDRIGQMSFEYHVGSPKIYKNILKPHYPIVNVYKDEIYAGH